MYHLDFQRARIQDHRLVLKGDDLRVLAQIASIAEATATANREIPREVAAMCRALRSIPVEPVTLERVSDIESLRAELGQRRLVDLARSIADSPSEPMYADQAEADADAPAPEVDEYDEA